MTGEVAIRVFGPVEIVRSDGIPARFSTRKAEQVFLHLALIAPRAVPRHVLATMFWADRGDEQARGSLRRALSDIRAALGTAEAVLSDRASAWCAPGVVRVDATEALALAAEGDSSALDRLAALPLAPLMPGFDPASDAVADWLRDWQSTAGSRILDALRTRLARLRESGRADEALAAAEQICALDPACEPTSRFLIEAHAMQGARQAALGRFESLRTALARDYDASPEPETAALVARLRLGASMGTTASGADRAAAIPAAQGVTRSDRPGPDGQGPLEVRGGAVLALRLATSESPDALNSYLDDAAAFERASAAIEAAGGYPLRTPDGLLLGIFGAPIAYGDDARRAFSATDAIRAELGRGAEAAMALAVGAILTDQRGASPVFSGTALREASALCRGADAGTLVLDPAATELFAAADRPQGDRAAGAAEETVFVGRELERTQIVAALGSAASRGRGRVAVLRGEPGIGKTRLAQQAIEDLGGRGMRSVVAHILDFGGRTRRDAVRQALRDLFFPGGADPERTIAGLLERIGADASRAPILYDVLDVAPTAQLASALDAIPAETRARLRCSLAADLFAQAAAERPLVVLFEDVHWADAGTLSGLAAIAGATRRAPLALLLTTRIEGDRLGADWRAEAQGAAVDTMDLAPFDTAEAQDMAAALGLTPTEEVRACIDRAGGNPLFLAQLLRHRSWVSGAAVPVTIQSAVQARLDLLEARVRELLQTASVFGQSFETEAFRALSGASAEATAALAHNGMLRPEPGGYRFAHALVRDAIYASLLPSRRRDLHRGLAAWFSGRDDTLVAEHLEQADDPGAAAAYARAARAQSGSYRYTRASELALAGLRLARDADERAELHTILGRAHLDLGDTGTAKTAFEAALAAAERAADIVEARLGLAGVRRITDDLDAAFADLDAADAVDDREIGLEMRARISFLRGNLHFPRGETEACRRAHERALACARAAGSAELEAMALGGLGDAAYLAGKMRTAHEQLGACVAIAEAHGFGRIAVANAAQRANAGVFLMPPEAALAEQLNARDRARDVGNLRAELNSFAGTLWCLHDLGRYAECLAATDEAEDLIARSGARRYRQLTLMIRGRALARLGETEAARASLSKARDVAGKTGLAFHGPEIMLGLAETASGRDARDRALAEGEALISAGCVGHGPLRFYPAAARLVAAADGPEAARPYLRAIAALHPEERLLLKPGRAEALPLAPSR